MKIFHNFDKPADSSDNMIVTIGNFDGIHLGHKKILQELKNEALDCNGTSLVITFVPHPRSVLTPEKFLPLLSTLKSRLKIMQELGIDYVLLAHFDENFAKITPVQFIMDYLVNKLQIKEIVIGENYFFGKNKEGNIDLLKKYGNIFNFKVRVVSPVIQDEKLVSSSAIRDFIRAGDLVQAEKFLGRKYSISGKVVTGSGRGRVLGFPTANLQELSELIPPHGVYYTKVNYNNSEFHALTNIGIRPTFGENQVHVETYILDFNESLYHKEITISFIKKIRDEKKFNGKSELIEQITKDIEKIRKII